MASTDRNALLVLYRSTNGRNWKNKTNWDTDADLSEWYGVETNEGRVVKLDLFSNNLQGIIPAEMGNLEALEELWLNGNSLEGSIPAELGALTNLKRLNLPNNKLTGPIPKELGALRRLEHLWLYSNQLTGIIPVELGRLVAVQELQLGHNQLIGTIPEELGNLASMTGLWLNDNNLEGSIPAVLGALPKLMRLMLHNNHLAGPTPKELCNLRTLKLLGLHSNELIEENLPARLPSTRWTGPVDTSIQTLLKGLTFFESPALLSVPRLLGALSTDAPDKPLTGGGRIRAWQERFRGARRAEPWAVSLLDALASLWHFILPIIDDVTDVAMLWATFEDRGELWWVCCVAFLLADVERAIVLLVTFMLVLCWAPFALLGTDETRGKRFRVIFRFLNGGRDLTLENIFVRFDLSYGEVWGHRPNALRWPVLDGLLWGVVGSRSKSTSFMRLCGMEGNTPVDAMEQSGFGLSLIDRIVYHHPYNTLAAVLFSCPHGHHVPGPDTATRKSKVMMRAVGETLVVDSLFVGLSVSTVSWEEGASIGVLSLLFSVLELLTELRYYTAEARANMVTNEEGAMNAEGGNLGSLELGPPRTVGVQEVDLSI